MVVFVPFFFINITKCILNYATPQAGQDYNLIKKSCFSNLQKPIKITKWKCGMMSYEYDWYAIFRL